MPSSVGGLECAGIALEARSQHFPPLAERRFGQPLHDPRTDAPGCSAGTIWTTAEVTFGRRHECRAIDGHRDSRPRAPLGRDREPPVGGAARLRDDALGDLLLEHQRQRPPPWRPIPPAISAGARCRHCKAGWRRRARLRRHRPLVDLRGIAFDDLQPAAERVLKLGQRRNAAPVPLDGDDACPRVEQRSRQAAGAGSDLVDTLALEIARDRGDPRKQLAVEDEILAKRLARAEAVPGDDLAQRLGRSCSSGFGALDARSRPPFGSPPPSGGGRRGPGRDIECGAVVRRGADDRQAERHVHRLLEMQRLDRDQRLVMVHAQGRVVIGARAGHGTWCRQGGGR